jgi:hypothetical protein
VLLASHALLDMQQIISGYSILSHGTIQHSGTWDPSADTDHYHLRLAAEDVPRARQALEAAGALILGATPISLDVRPSVPPRQIHHTLYAADVVPDYVEPVRASLEDIFLAVVGEAP